MPCLPEAKYAGSELTAVSLGFEITVWTEDASKAIRAKSRGRLASLKKHKILEEDFVG